MKYFVFLLLWLSISGISSAAFLSETVDIPLMEGMTLSDEEENFNFDTPAGQIVTVTATTAKTEKEVRSFYRETLPSLGWKIKKDDVFHRGKDLLVIKIDTSKEKQTTVSFSMTLTET